MIFPIAGAVGLTQVPRTKPGALMACYYVAFLFSAIRVFSSSSCQGSKVVKSPSLTLIATYRAPSYFLVQPQRRRYHQARRHHRHHVRRPDHRQRKSTPSSLHPLLTPCLPSQIVGPQVYLTKEAPFYHTGIYVDIGCWTVEFILVITMGLHLRRLNRKQEARRVALGLPANIKDTSIMSTAEADAYKVELTELMRAQGMDLDKFNEHSFDDMTDFENPNFQYVV